MKALVTYFSETGNTEKVAKAIFEGIDLAKKEILPLGEVKGTEGYDVIFCGFPVIASSVPSKVEPFLKSLPEGAHVAFFATHGSQRGGQLAVTAFDYAMTLTSRAKVVGTFGCRGKVKDNLLETLIKKPEHKAWAEEAQSGAGTHPDEADLADARKFAARILAKVRAL
jgi:flavodoxin